MLLDVLLELRVAVGAAAVVLPPRPVLRRAVAALEAVDAGRGAGGGGGVAEGVEAAGAQDAAAGQVGQVADAPARLEVERQVDPVLL